MTKAAVLLDLSQSGVRSVRIHVVTSQWGFQLVYAGKDRVDSFTNDHINPQLTSDV